MPSYTKTVWQDLPNTTTPINATNLNNIENGVETLYSEIQTIENDVDDLDERFNNVVLWEGEELPAGKTYTLTDNIFNYRLAIIEGQWGNKFVIPIIQGNNYFNGGMNYPLGNGTAMATTGLNASIVNNGLGISVTYFRQLTHNANSNHAGFVEPQLYKIIGVK